MLRIAPLFLFALLLFGCPEGGMAVDDDSFASDDDTGDDDDDVSDDDSWPECSERHDDVLEAFEAEMEAYGAPGAAIAVIEGGEVTCAHGWGTRTPDEDDPVKPTTLFRIGSQSKMLTAAGLLQQVEDGAVDLDASVTEYVPYFNFLGHPEWTEEMLVEHTLEQTSGMYDYTEIDGYDDPDDLEWFFDTYYTQRAYVMAPPGRFYNYSNPNFMLAGLLIEEATGQYYLDYMEEHVLGPLGMDRTYIDPGDALADGDFATGLAYDWTGATGDQVLSGPDSYDNVWARPAGFTWSSVLDMARFAIFLMEGDTDVLADPWREAMTEPQHCTEELGELTHYGYGTFVYEGFFMGSDFHDVRMNSHGGAIPGFAADMYFLPDQQAGIVCLASTDGAYPYDTLGAALETLVELPAPVTPPDLSVDPDSYSELAGEYRDEYNVGDIVVRSDDATLQVQFPLLDDIGYSYDAELYPYSPDNFVLYIEGTGMLVTFIRSDTGRVEYFRTRYFVGERAVDVAGGGGGDAAAVEQMLWQLRLHPDWRL